jgi:hypothetical protein
MSCRRTSSGRAGLTGLFFQASGDLLFDRGQSGVSCLFELAIRGADRQCCQRCSHRLFGVLKLFRCLVPQIESRSAKVADAFAEGKADLAPLRSV